jgi:hypothetical protein
MGKMSKKKMKALMANVISPGAGHFVLKKWIRGGLFTLITIGAIIWLIGAFAVCIIGLYKKAAQGGDVSFNYIYLLIPFLAVFVIWGYSYVDLLFFCKDPGDDVSDVERNGVDT